MTGLESPIRFFAADECLESVTLPNGRVQLLSTGASSEVTRCEVLAGKRLTLVPEGRVNETYYILQGAFQSEDKSNPRLLRAGEHLVSSEIVKPLIFRALCDTTFLYFSSKPQFHHISGNLTQLRQMAIEVELKDQYTADHCGRLQKLSYTTGRVLGLDQEQLFYLDFGAFFHDVGKTRIPESILLKPAKLDPEEFAVIKKHPQLGKDLLNPTCLQSAGFVVEQHHERSDGSGYPYGLAGDDVSVEASIVAVADTFDAMTTDRPYRKALPAEVAFAELRRYAGIHYPREVVRAFFEAVNRLEPARAA